MTPVPLIVQMMTLLFQLSVLGSAVAALGYDFVFAGTPIGESCPVTCDSCDGDSHQY